MSVQAGNGPLPPNRIVDAAWLALGVAAVVAALIVSLSGKSAHTSKHAARPVVAAQHHRHRAGAGAPHRRKPLTLLATGDSEIQEVDAFLAQDLKSDNVRVRSDARVSTGISKPQLLDWQAHAGEQVSQIHPNVTVMFIGGNDGYALKDSSANYVQCCGPRWVALFAGLTRKLMADYTRAGGRVYWFLLPAPNDPDLERNFLAVNAAYRIAAAGFPGRVHLIDAYGFFTPGGVYRDNVGYRNQTVSVRSSDGYHLSTAGNRIAAQLVANAMRADHVVR